MYYAQERESEYQEGSHVNAVTEHVFISYIYSSQQVFS